MFMVGNVSETAQELCRTTKYALDEAIKMCGPGVPIREVGKVRLIRTHSFKLMSDPNLWHASESNYARAAWHTITQLIMY